MVSPPRSRSVSRIDGGSAWWQPVLGGSWIEPCLWPQLAAFDFLSQARLQR